MTAEIRHKIYALISKMIVKIETGDTNAVTKLAHKISEIAGEK